MQDSIRIWRGVFDAEAVAQKVFDALLSGRGCSSATFFFNRELAAGRYTRQSETPIDINELPSPADRSISGYVARIQQQTESRFCLRMVSSGEHDSAVGTMLSVLFADLDRDVGPCPRKNVVLFVGNYDFTPAGVHTDTEPIIQALVSGAKRAHFWAPEVWESKLRDPRTPQSYLTEARTFDLRPGDMIYWPNGQYHVFESIALSVAVSCGCPGDSSS